MFCSRCGEKIEDDARFCSHCGAAVSGPVVSGAPVSGGRTSGMRVSGAYDSRESESAPGPDLRRPDTGEPLFVVRPRFLGWVTALSVLPIQFFMTVWGAGFFGGFGLFAVQVLGLRVPPWFTFALFGVVFFLGVPIVVYTAKKRTYARTEYRFFRNRLEYAEGFWTAVNKTIQYDRITETVMRRGIIQKRYGLGTIFLATPATGYRQGRAASGIRLLDIEEPERVYDTVQRLIGR